MTSPIEICARFCPKGIYPELRDRIRHIFQVGSEDRPWTVTRCLQIVGEGADDVEIVRALLDLRDEVSTIDYADTNLRDVVIEALLSINQRAHVRIEANGTITNLCSG